MRLISSRRFSSFARPWPSPAYTTSSVFTPSVRSARQSHFFGVKNGSDTCFRAGMDPGEGIYFFDACDYPGLVDANGDRNGDGWLGNEPEDGGIWLTDRVTGAAIELTAISFVPPIR